MTTRFISWDFRTPPTAEHLADEIASFGPVPIYAVPLDNGTDDYVLVLSDQPITPEQALERWES
jgi:hypothetical protein